MNASSSAYEIMQSLTASSQLSLHTPAHQGQSNQSGYFPPEVYAYDFPFLTRDRTKGVEKHLSDLYETKHTFFLTGGATQGNLVACALLAGSGRRRIAVALNSHICVIHGMILSALDPVLIPSSDLMPTADEIITALEEDEQGVDALLLTHPSYEGTVTDIQAVAQHCQERDIALIIDEAHGTHFPFFAEATSALAHRCDLVIHSLHKYVGSFVQTALLHLPPASRFTTESVLTALSLFENTARSNLLMLSIEDAVKTGFGDEGRSLFDKSIQHCHQLREQLDQFGTLLSYDGNVYDPLKLFLCSDRATGNEIAQLLFECGIDYEYANTVGVLLIFSFQNSTDDFRLVSQTLTEIRNILSARELQTFNRRSNLSRRPIMRTLPRTAFFAKKTKLPLNEAQGMISCNCLKEVPPGIPVLIPGEEITAWHIQRFPCDTMVEVMADSTALP